MKKTDQYGKKKDNTIEYSQEENYIKAELIAILPELMLSSLKDTQI